MCLVAIAIGRSRQFPWVLASNRDEFLDRPTQPLSWWRPDGDTEPILGGRDLSAGGTWLGLSASGRLALVTNVRGPGTAAPGTPSRGELVPQWLRAAAAEPDPDAIVRAPRNGFNLFAADLSVDPFALPAAEAAIWLSNRPPRHRRLGPGTYGLSNAALDTPWPKVRQLKRRLHSAVADSTSADALFAAAFGALRDPLPAGDAELPSTGVPLERERQLSPAFIRIPAQDGVLPGYGTRCSTVVAIEQRGARRVVHVVEHTFDADGQLGATRHERFELARAGA